MRRIIIKGAGVLYSEIILTALQEYKKLCEVHGNYAREDVVQHIINIIEFDHSEL